MSSSQGKPVQLGFVEDQDDWLLTNKFFPSKIGGFAAWLELQNIPEQKDLLCDYCGEPCIFLCQIYAGSERQAHAFHRSIFVFICRNGKCCSLNQSGNIKVLRSQLPLVNNFYPDTPADETVETPAIESPVALCKVCGIRGPMICGKCKKANYCGLVHQKLDWATHKQFCTTQSDLKEPASEILFPEFEIIIEQEEIVHSNQEESDKEADKRRIKEYEELLKSGQAGSMNCDDLKEIEETKEDKTFSKFKKSIESYETQVLRYNRHGSPLWISDLEVLNPSNVPKCINCSGPRSFEFQIMPQMLNELKNYELDWGVIAVYTCENDCDVNGKYIQEFSFKQDIVSKEEDVDSIDLNNLKLKNNKKSNEVDSDDDDEEMAIPKPAPRKLQEHKTKSEKVEKKKPQKVTKKAFEETEEW